jgi:K+-transporting ATPase ATPase C chain
MKESIFISIRLFMIMTVITGIIYPLCISAVSRIFFHEKAEGSLVKRNGLIVGSKLIGQEFDSAVYFWSRPSAVNYNPLPSGASNLSWSDRRLKEMAYQRKEAFIKENFLNDTTVIPTEMLFSSGSGLDPHISPLAARLQIDRIAKARNFDEDQKKKLAQLVDRMTEKPQFSLFGEERINVFQLNLEVDNIK